MATAFMLSNREAFNSDCDNGDHYVSAVNFSKVLAVKEDTLLDAKWSSSLCWENKHK